MMSAQNHDMKRSIIAVVQHHGETSLQQIAVSLGVDVNAKLRKFLSRMVKSLVLERTERGVYIVSPNYSLVGLDVYDLTEAKMERFLTNCGGISRTQELHKAVWGWPEPFDKDALKSFGYQCVVKVLKNSPKFQNMKYGIWALHEREHLPMLGRFTNVEFSTLEARDDFFKRVGAAFEQARGHIAIETIINDPEIRDVLVTIAENASGARSAALGDLRDAVAEEVNRLGLEPWVCTQMILERKDRALVRSMYEAFEQGNVSVHFNAPIEFYNGCALLFCVKAAKLSRGHVEPIQAAMAAE